MRNNKTTATLRILNKFIRLEHSAKALLIALPISLLLLISLLSIGAADLVFSNWFITLVSASSLIANQLATSFYLGRITDFFSDMRQTIRENKRECIGMLIGMVMGIGVGIGLAVMHIAIPLTSSLSAFATVLFILRQMNLFAGPGGCLGRCSEKTSLPNSRPISERVIVFGACLLGLTLGTVLFATCTAAMVSVVGITAFFSGGLAIPAWIAGIIFILSVTCASTSTADYTANAISFIRSHFIAEGMVTRTVQERRYEYGGSLIGIGLGLAVGAMVITALILTNPLLLVGIIGVVASGLILVTTMGIFGSICARTGRVIDRFVRPDTPPEMNDIELKTIRESEIQPKPTLRKSNSHESFKQFKTTVTAPIQTIHSLFPRKRSASFTDVNSKQNTLRL